MALCGRAMLALLVILGLHSASATQFTVGGNGGWTFQTSSNSVYTDQFKNTTLVVGDTLLFDFTTGSHNVYEIPPADLPACNFANPIQTFTTGPAVVPLSSAGVHAFGCEIPSHCTSGMQLSVTVLAVAPAAAPSSSPTLPPVAPPTATPLPAPAAVPVTPPTVAPAPVTAAPAPVPTTSAPALSPGLPLPAPSLAPEGGLPPHAKAPTPSGSGSGSSAGSTISSASATVVAAVFAGVAYLLI